MPGMPADPMTAEGVRSPRRSRTAQVVKARDLDWSTVQRDTWIWAGTPVCQPYPCMCQEWIAVTGYSRCGKICPDAGRTDTGHLPEGCCAVGGRGSRQTGTGRRAPIPLAALPRRPKLKSPAAVTVADILAEMGGTR